MPIFSLNKSAIEVLIGCFENISLINNYKMSQFELKMPKMGESVEQATITRWFVKEGDKVEEDDALLEIATDKVDSEIPSPVEGTVIKVFYRQDDLVPVGTTIALIGTGGEVEVDSKEEVAQAVQTKVETTKQQEQLASSDIQPTRFYSPLVKSIAKQEHISVRELEQISGSGKDGRVRKEDILAFLSSRSKVPDSVLKAADSMPSTSQAAAPAAEQQQYRVSVSVGAEDTIIVMDRMRKLIAEHMVTSKHVAAHVTAMVEADVTGLVEWRDKNKEQFQKRYGEKLTFMPMFTDAVAKSLRDFPMVNSSLDGDKIILRKHVNIGIAVALPSGNLIVPVVQDADLKNLAGLAADINSLAQRARDNKLSPDNIQGGTFTISNFGSFRNVMGTPIINQPQVAILAVGTIEKKPAVMETPYGDMIVPRHKIFLSLTYDHRIVDGALGGAFLRKIADYLEQFDPLTLI